MTFAAIKPGGRFVADINPRRPMIRLNMPVNAPACEPNAVDLVDGRRFCVPLGATVEAR